MAALAGRVEIDQLGVRTPRPRSRRAIDLFRKVRYGHWDRDPVGLQRAGSNQCLLAVLPCGSFP